MAKIAKVKNNMSGTQSSERWEHIEDIEEAYEELNKLADEKQRLEQKVETANEVLGKPVQFPEVDMSYSGDLLNYMSNTGRHSDTRWQMMPYQSTDSDDYIESINDTGVKISERFADISEKIDSIESDVNEIESDIDKSEHSVKSTVDQVIAKRVSAPLVLSIGILTTVSGVIELISFNLTSIPLLGIGIFAFVTLRKIATENNINVIELM